MVDIWKNVAASILFILILNTALFVQSDVGKSCDDSNFPCDNGECISPIFWCDSIEDCSDASDEAYCKNSTDQNGNPNKCSDKFFKCNDGTCIPLIGRCDGLSSCEDNSDEIGCPTIVKSTGIYSRPEKISADSYRHLNFAHQYKKALLWLLSQRNDKLGWGEETPRVLTALHLTDFWLFEKRKEVKSLLLKQLEVQLSLAMLK
ncbi:hypothetical protein TNIN_208621 [Trichonephila inaurata madagascariensis]|uniref:Uncharacterized protein n=1 Tax=Trichonephila inaurata madagascariensis TaxID=2747483 RepID=A0A8X7C426_9ARAC|nr:hypothetical protein TNIN_208621 [Trichonephila inaurata madagascariensis]